MNPATLALIIQGFQAAIAEAPKVIDLVVKAKDYIAGLFAAKLITKDQQDLLHAHIDSIAKMAQAGIIPPSWQVEADPA